MSEGKTDNRKIVFSDEELLKLNPGNKPLTVERLRSFEGLENLSDEEAQEVIFSIQTFCSIVLEAIKAEEENINQQKIAA